MLSDEHNIHVSWPGRHLTHEYLLKIFRYDPESGHLTWRIRRIGVKPFSRAGGVSGGRRLIQLDGRTYLESHVIWFYMTAKWPPLGRYVDHKDGNAQNNQWSNLRLATKRQKSQKRGPRRGGTSQYIGVSWHGRDQKWRAQIRVGGRNILLGNFDDEIEAAKARDKAARKYFKQFASLNFPGPMERQENRDHPP